ncbi:acyl-CoA dehydrogenase family protein [Novosphingobium sp. Gsoil 351]|uniref:acyl-CoA dehydrogenase family protein n=1 Tax=Novosphingobium sp. Gsoil 351 TaxID=2675225 RepID=UPI0012B4B573|nr:acyl-CoA dehydrogenase family protein [Novosphingobium sp. Gsoil 351]QGN54612.1 pimeloyl-CoA dehydrogenase small subunit [Novosphingobium sp. Gsoil 351]
MAETFGGLGLVAREAEPIMAALGETGRSTPFLESSVVAAGLLGRFSGVADATLRKLAGDGTVCAVAGIDPRLRGGLAGSSVGEEWTLSGRAKLVLHAESAMAFLVVVPLGFRVGLFLVEPGAGYRIVGYPTIDGRRAADVTFADTPALLVSDDAAEAVDVAIDEALACIAVEAAAIMRRLVRDTVSYTRQRHQFGQTLSQFQVVQHRLVDMHIQARRAEAIGRRAMEALDGPADVRSRIVSAAKATVAAAGRYVGQQAVQLHGAMGMTAELPLSGFFKRLTVIENELGSADKHLARYASLREAR